MLKTLKIGTKIYCVITLCLSLLLAVGGTAVVQMSSIGSEIEAIAEREVEVGLRNWDFVQITGGLDESDRVITSLDRPEVKAGAEAVEVAELSGA